MLQIEDRCGNTNTLQKKTSKPQSTAGCEINFDTTRNICFSLCLDSLRKCRNALCQSRNINHSHRFRIPEKARQAEMSTGKWPFASGKHFTWSRVGEIITKYSWVWNQFRYNQKSSEEIELSRYQTYEYVDKCTFRRDRAFKRTCFQKSPIKFTTAK